MRKLALVIITIIGFTFQSNAQLEITTAPLGLLTNSYTLSADYYISPDWSFGGDMRSRNFLGNKKSMFYANAKHYFNPFGEAKRYYVGVFAGVHNHQNWNFFDNNNEMISDFGGGFIGGYKLVSRKNIVLDVALGAGRAFSENSSEINLMPYWKLNLGYKFTTPKDKKISSELESF